MRGQGPKRVMFGTNWPMISPSRCLAKLDQLELDEAARHLFLGGNAHRIFRLKAESAANDVLIPTAFAEDA
jgi:predicted TIM-barrel fold metal-dependent hydrolase